MRKNKDKGFRAVTAVLVLLLAPVSLLLFSGCGSGYNSSGHRRNAIKYLSGRYGIKFTFSEPYPSPGNVFGKHSGYADILAECEELPGKKIRASSLDGKSWSDDFIYRKYEDEWKRLITETAQTVYSGRIRVEMGDCFVKGLPADASMEELFSAEKTLSVMICTCDCKDYEGDFGRLAGAFAEQGMNFALRVEHYGDDSYMEAESIRGDVDYDIYRGFASFEGIGDTTMSGPTDKKIVFHPSNN